MTVAQPVWALDLDGVVWLARSGIPGGAKAVDELRSAGKRVVFLTNNSGPHLGDHVAALGKVGIDCGAEDVATSAQAAAAALARGQRVAVVGDEGIMEALSAVDVTVVEPGDHPDVVLVGRKVQLDYWELAAAASAVRAGAVLWATNTDATFPAGEGVLLPGAGALVSFIVTASGREAEVAGKPHAPMAGLVRQRYGPLEMMVGDRADTDGLFARVLNTRFGLVLSGVTTRGDLPVDPQPDVVADDLLSLVCAYLDRPVPR